MSNSEREAGKPATPKTAGERVAAMRQRKRMRSISLEGEALDRLAQYQKDKGLASRSEAIRALLDLGEKQERK